MESSLTWCFSDSGVVLKHFPLFRSLWHEERSRPGRVHNNSSGGQDGLGRNELALRHKRLRNEMWMSRCRLCCVLAASLMLRQSHTGSHGAVCPAGRTHTLTHRPHTHCSRRAPTALLRDFTSEDGPHSSCSIVTLRPLSFKPEDKTQGGRFGLGRMSQDSRVARDANG